MNFNERFKSYNIDINSMYEFQKQIDKNLKINIINYNGNLNTDNLINLIKNNLRDNSFFDNMFYQSKISFEKLNKISNIEDNMLGFNQILDVKYNKIINIYGFYLYNNSSLKPFYMLFFYENDILKLFIKENCEINELKLYKKELFETLFENVVEIIDDSYEENLTDKLIETLTLINYSTEDKNIKNILKLVEKEYNIRLE